MVGSGRPVGVTFIKPWRKNCTVSSKEQWQCQAAQKGHRLNSRAFQQMIASL